MTLEFPLPNKVTESGSRENIVNIMAMTSLRVLRASPLMCPPLPTMLQIRLLPCNWMAPQWIWQRLIPSHPHSRRIYRPPTCIRKDSTYAASRAFDGDINTRWATDSATKRAWLQADFAHATRIKGVKNHGGIQWSHPEVRNPIPESNARLLVEKVGLL